MVVLFVFVGLFLGAILKEVKKKVNIPYSPMLMGIGIILGYFYKSLGMYGESIEVIVGIDPHSMLMVFIPGLVFEGAYNSDGYVLNKIKWQILLLAGPGVLITSVILAYGLKFIFRYQELSIP